MLLQLALIPTLFFSQVNPPLNAGADTSLPTVTHQIEARQIDRRTQILADYFAQYDSPLQYHAQDFIDAADINGVDWKLVPAIAGVESTFGKFIPGGYNAWGWGVYGNQALAFSSWRNGIFTVTEGLKKNYIDQGLTNPYTMSPVYAASPTWGYKVDYFMKDLDSLRKTKGLSNQPKMIVVLNKTAGVSAELGLK